MYKIEYNFSIDFYNRHPIIIKRLSTKDSINKKIKKSNIYFTISLKIYSSLHFK